MSKNSETIKKRMSESVEFKHAFEEEQAKLDLADVMFEWQKYGFKSENWVKKVEAYKNSST